MNNKDLRNKIIVVAGPTASGKTALGIELARALGGEIISADSMQVYKGMPIATAAPTRQERAMAAHHLTEFLCADEPFSVARWCELAGERADEIISRGNIPIIVGGTGLFIDSFVDNLVFEDIPQNDELRRELMARSADALYAELEAADPQAAAAIHKNNKKRVVRALELCYAGSSKTRQNINSRKSDPVYEVLYFFVNYADRSLLYDRINRRVDSMLANGLVQEAARANSLSRKTSAQAIGHKELEPYIKGESTLESCVEKLKQETRRYAKRQITWFKRRDDAVLLQPDIMGEKMADFALSVCEDFLNGRFPKNKKE